MGLAQLEGEELMRGVKQPEKKALHLELGCFAYREYTKARKGGGGEAEH